MKVELFKTVSALPNVLRFFAWRKDGGYESKVQGFFVVEIKKLFTIAVLRFDEGGREAFHSHAFNCISWVLSGGLREVLRSGGEKIYRPGLRPVVTRRSTNHQVFGLAKSTWVVTFRGPWSDTWEEFVPSTGETKTLTYGRRTVT